MHVQCSVGLSLQVAPFHLTFGHLICIKTLNRVALSEIPRNNPAASPMVQTHCNSLTYENKKKLCKNMKNCTFLQHTHSLTLMRTNISHSSPSSFHLFYILFPLTLRLLGSTAPHISNYAAALSTAVTHRLTQASSSLITVT